MLRWRIGLCRAAAAAALGSALPAAGQMPRTLEAICPCAVERDGDTVTATLGARNHGATPTGELRVELGGLVNTGDGPRRHVIGKRRLAALAGNAALQRATYTLDEFHTVPPGEYDLFLALYNENERVDTVWMAGARDPSAATFRAGNEDWLADADGDGVGDRNERLAGTAAADPASTPGVVTVDVLALYTSGFRERHGGDPHTRILHVATVTNEIFRRSQTGVRFRMVGFVETEVRNAWNPFAEPARAFLKPLEDRHGADVVLLFRLVVPGRALCGWATAPSRHRGRIRFAEQGGHDRNLATVFADCADHNTAHELGHVLGLGHSLRQGEAGTFRWSRGHYVLPEDGLGIYAAGTVMTYGHTYLDRFSTPNARCGEQPCGVAIDSLDGANAVQSLGVTRFQVAALRPPQPDADGDGFVAPFDDDDDNPDIWRDHDRDGVNDDVDADDDGDGVADENDAFPLDARDWRDADGDGVGDNADVFPEHANREVPLFIAAGRADGRQGFVRIINRSRQGGEVRIAAFDDEGKAAERVTLAIAPLETVHFNSTHLEQGDEGRGLPAIGAGAGDWRLVLASTLAVEVLAYVRTPDGFLTAMHDTAPWADGAHRVRFFNPASNTRQRSLLRLANPGATPVKATITGVDDQGRSPGTAVRVTVPAGAARTLDSRRLEAGDGLDGALGDGSGKWRLAVAADGDLRVMSLMESPSGHLSNLSTAPDLGLPFLAENGGDGEHLLLFPSTADDRRQGFARILNRDIFSNPVRVVGHDGGANPRATRFEISVDHVAHFNSNDLADGKPALGMEALGAAEAPWWLRINGAEAVHALAYVRTADGFVTSMHDVAPAFHHYWTLNGGGRHEVVTFNPASNRARRSLLRLVNPRPQGDANVTIRGIDDAGNASRDPVRLTLPALRSRTLSAEDLETGRAAGLEGALGDGKGKWRLVVDADALIAVMSLLESANTGHLTNLSTGTAPRPACEPVLMEHCEPPAEQ